MKVKIEIEIDYEALTAKAEVNHYDDGEFSIRCFHDEEGIITEVLESQTALDYDDWPEWADGLSDWLVEQI